MDSKKTRWKTTMTGIACSYSPQRHVIQNFQIISELSVNNEYSLYAKVSRLQAENQILREKVQQLEQQVCFDGLTGLSRRELCIDVLNRLLSDSTTKRLAVVFFDLDNLKSINDKLGHYAGDKVICYFANMLKKHCHAGAFVARFGGDEFVVLLPEYNHKQAESWCQSLQFKLADQPCYITGDESSLIYFSAGIHTWQCEADNTAMITENVRATELIQIADQRMYQVKREKKSSTRLMQKYEF